MEEILGELNTHRAFAGYLARWREIMVERIESAAEAVSQTPGVSGLILAGSNGAGNPWPLSDIDLIPIVAEASLPAVLEGIERTRVSMLAAWSQQGWRTGLDIGRLYFTDREAASVGQPDLIDALDLLRDDRWYYAIDKAYRGRPLIDATGDAELLAAWMTAHRFQSEIVTLRLERSAREAKRSLEMARAQLAAGNRIGALSHQLKSVQWVQINRMESWGERDNSLGRFGTRFEQAAERHGADELCRTLDVLCALDEDSVTERLRHAPSWVHERLRRSWDARQAIGEPVTVLQNNRDVLRVCTIYELRVVGGAPNSVWLAAPPADLLARRLALLEAIVNH